MVCKPAWNLISQWLRNEIDTGKLAALFCTINVPLQQRPILAAFCQQRKVRVMAERYWPVGKIRVKTGHFDIFL